MANHLYIAVLVLSTLACGLPAALPASAPAPELSPAPTPPAQVVEMIVVADALNIRAEATYLSVAETKGLHKGELVKVYLTCTGGWVRDWVALDRDCTRWVNVDYLAIIRYR